MVVCKSLWFSGIKKNTTPGDQSKQWIEDTGIEEEDVNSVVGWGFSSSLMKSLK